MLYSVALLSPPFTVLTYAEPEYLKGFSWGKGLRVAVPLGRGKLRVGVVLGASEPDSLPEGVVARPMLWPLEREPLLPEAHLELVRQLALRQAVPQGQILATVLPSGLRLAELKLRVLSTGGGVHLVPLHAVAALAEQEQCALGKAWLAGDVSLLSPGEDAAASELCTLQCDPPWPVRPSAARQIELLDFLLERGSVSRRLVLQQLGQGIRPALQSLVRQGLLAVVPQSVALPCFAEEEAEAPAGEVLLSGFDCAFAYASITCKYDTYEVSVTYPCCLYSAVKIL